MPKGDEWRLYDMLVEGMPCDGANDSVESCAIGPVWTYVRTADGRMGVAMTPLCEYQPVGLRGHVRGMGRRELAEYVRSWNFHEAAFGHAAINSWYNRIDRLPGGDPCIQVVTSAEKRLKAEKGSWGKFSLFDSFKPLMCGKKVAIIGHADPLVRLREICDLTILERLPRPGCDLPDPACEYVLPQQDFVFITGSSFTNKTAPRLIELSAGATTVLWGPSVPLCPGLFDLGVDVLMGQAIDDPDEAARVICEGGLSMDFSHCFSSVTWCADASLAESLNLKG